MERFNTSDKIIASLFFIIPIIFLIVGILFFKYPLSNEIKSFLSIPLYISLVFLFIGLIINKKKVSNILKIIGWSLFAFFWSTQPNSLYFGEDGDIVNAFVASAGVVLIFYMAYHEWLSIKLKKDLNCLNWIAGVAAISGIIYFGIELTPLAMQLREIVAAQSGALLNFFTGEVLVDGVNINYKQAYIELIFACTAVQSMVLFVGMILPLRDVNARRKVIGLLATVVPVYFLNLVRNALVTYLTGEYGPEFFSVAHNYIGKGGSLIALILLLLIVIKMLPEVFDEILNLTDLYKRDGPFERAIKLIKGNKSV
jgi:archaeosortase A (PGF-CTERM-specific)